MTALKTETSTRAQVSLTEPQKLELLLKERRYSELELHCLSLLRQDPGQLSLYHLLGLAQSGLSKYEEAIKSYRKFLEFKSDYGDTYINLAIACEKCNRLDDALVNYQQALQLMPENAVIHHLIGVLYVELGKGHDAIACFRQAVKFSPENSTYYNKLGAALNNTGEYTEAVEILQKSVNLNKHDSEAYQNLGHVYSNLNQMDEASECFEKAASISTRDHNVLYSAGGACLLNGKYRQAINFYQKALKVSPDQAATYGNLAAAYGRVGEYLKSLEASLKAIELDPELEWVLVNFAESLSCTRGKMEASDALIKNILRCFQSGSVESYSVSSASIDILKKKLPQIAATKEPVLAYLENPPPLVFELLIELVSGSILPDIQFEDYLVSLRKEICEKYNTDKSLSDRAILIIQAIALQSRLNEYLWFQSSSEKTQMLSLISDIETDLDKETSLALEKLYLYGAYFPLHTNDKICKWAQSKSNKITDKGVLDFLQVTILDPLEEKEIAKEIPRLTSVDDTVSRAVQNQYEENPYPTWQSITLGYQSSYTERIALSIYPNMPEFSEGSTKPDILIAGCGTGRHALSSAHEYLGAEVLAIDLSLASLSYARRSAEKYNIKNVRFAQADILKLDEINEDFDVIESVGVLHHMQDPVAGLQSLLRHLKTGGFLRLGLYSSTARAHIHELRSQLDTQKIETAREDIREFRYKLRNEARELFNKVMVSRDFYSASSLRDLLLHVQEHCFSIPQLQSIIRENGMEFLGFVFRDSRTKLAYLNIFPEDEKCLNLENWTEFEKTHPRAFAGMYQFWCRKVQ